MTGTEPQALTERIEQLAREQPDAPALQCAGERLTRGQLWENVSKFANALVARQLQPGDTVGIITSHNVWWPVCHLAALAAGACVVPISSTLPAATTARIAEDAELRFIVTSSAHHSLVDEALSLAPAIASRGRFAIDFAAAGWESLTCTLSNAAANFAIRPRAADDAVEIIYSSGTTGTPKGIVMGQRARTHAYLAYAAAGIDATATALCSTPPYANPSVGMTFGTLYGGGRVILMPKFDALEFLQLASHERATHMFLVPTQLTRLLDQPRFDEFDLTATRIKLLGGAPLHADTKREAVKRWPGALIETYGMTEGGPAALLRVDEFPDKIDSVGRVPPGVTIKIIDTTGREVAPGEVGEIVGKSNFAMLRYHRRPELSAALLWRDADGGEYIRSGDLGRLDPDGFLYLAGRSKDMIISGGFNIYPADLENVLRTHPAVRDCAVIGMPSERWGETPLGLVETHEHSATPTQEILEWTNARLGKHQRLAALESIDSLPRSSMGKVLKEELRQRFARPQEHTR